MASNRRVKAMCDISGFVYDRKDMRLNSYGMLVGPLDFDGNYDLKNHPQNRIADVRDNPVVKDPRPDIGGRNLDWEQASFNWDDSKVQYWSNA
jgi:hypothetical protein